MALAAGATNGPVDMSVNCVLTVVEAATLAALLPGLDCTAALRTRLLAAEAQAEQQGSATLSLALAPAEQGFLLAALADVSCHFSGDLRARVQALALAKMQSLGVTSGGLQQSGATL